MTTTKKRLLSFVLAVVMIFGSFSALTIVASAYSTGTYQVATSSGINVRSGPGTGYSKVGAASNGTAFTVSKISGSWGYTSSIRCTNGTRSGWVSLDYCKSTSSGSSNSNRSTYNDVFASYKGSGYNLSQARSSEATSFKKGEYVYIWGWLHDAGGNLYKTYGSGTCNITLSIYRPNGNCAGSYTYSNCDCNWIRCKFDTAGSWKIQSKITGSLTGTNTRTISITETSSTVNPTSVSLDCSSISMNKGSSTTVWATVYPSNATNKSVTWSSSNSSVASVDNGRVTAKAPGTATITARTSNGKTASCKVAVKGIVINTLSVYTVGDIDNLSASSYGVSTSRSWSSSDSSVISVNSSGKITCKKAGLATITVRTSDGYSASQSFRVYAKTTWKTGKFDSGYVAQSYTTVTLNKNSGNGNIRIYSYDSNGRKSSGKMHITLRSYTGEWIWEGDISSGNTLKLGNDHSIYRVYIARKQYPNTVIGNGDDFVNSGKCVSWSIECRSNCYV